MRKRIMAMLLALVMVVGVLPVAALAEEPVSDTEPTTVPTETTAPTEATALAEAVQADVSQYALTDDISTYDAFNCYVALIPDSINAKPTGFKVKVGDTVNGYKVLSLNSRTYEVHIDIGVLQSESALPKFRIPLPEEIWTGVKATDSTWVLCVDHWKPGDTMKLDRGGNQMRYYSMGTEWYFSLNYDANGGSGAPAAQTHTTNTASETSYTFTIPQTVPTRKGYTFQGWSFEKNGTASYQPGQTCTLTRPKDGAITSILYAVWEKAVPSKPQWSDIRGEMQKVSVHVTCSNPDVNHTDKTYPYQESTDDVIGYVQDSAGSYTCTVTVHLGRYRTKYNQDFHSEHNFESPIPAAVVLKYNDTGWEIISGQTLELKLTCGAALTPDPPGQDVLGRLLVQVECDAITYHFTKTYQLDDGDYELKKVDDNTYTVTVTADKYVEKYNVTYAGHTLFDNNTKTIKLVYRYGAWTVVGSNGVTFNVSCEQKYTVTYTDGVDGEVVFNDQVYYKKPGEKTPAFRGTPTRTGYKFIGWEPAVAATVTGNATYTAVWEEAAPQVTKPTKEFLIKEFKIATVKCTTEGSGHGEQSYPLTESSISIGDPVDDGTYYYCLVTVTSAPYVEMFDTATGSTHTAGAATDQQTAYCFDGQNWFVSHSIDGSVLFPIVFKVTCDTEPEIPDPASGAFDNWNIQLDCVTDDSHDQQLRYSDGTYRFERDADPQYGRLVFDAASYLAKYNEFFKDDHGNHGLNDATAAVTLELAYKDGQWQPKVPNALPTIQVTCANEPEAPEKPTHEDLKNIIASVKLQCVTAPDPAHADQLYSLNENAYDVTNPTLEDGQYTCVVTVKSDYYLNNLNQYDLGPHTISGDTRKNIKLIWDSQNKNWAAEDGKKQKIVFNIQCETLTVTYTDGVDGVEVFADVVHEKLPYGAKTPAFYTKDPFRKGYVFTGWNPAVAATVTGNATYAAVWEEDANGNGTPDKDEEKYTVTYTDGVENEEIFADQVYSNLLPDTATPAFNGTPTRTGYVFGGWNPAVAAKVTGSQTYTATWKPDVNGNGIADDLEDKFTVTYTDGVENEEIFADQVYGNLLSGTATPAFNGTPTRTGYVFTGWNPTIAAKVTESKIYSATWKPDANGNGIADDLEDKFTVTYTDGMDGKIFVNQVHENLLSGIATPAFNGTPTRTGYVFGGWNPAVAAKVTGSQTYTATWKADANGNGIADDEEDTYTVTYTDGVKGKAFADQVYDNLLSGTDTPAFNGKPIRKGYTFVSWTPKVTDTVTKTVTYTATWKANSGKDNVPKTGDSGIVPVLGSVLLFSFCGAAACVFDRKRKHI